MKQANPSTNKIEETHERIGKIKEDASANASRMLLSMKNNEVDESNTICLTIPHIPSAGKSCVPQHLDKFAMHNSSYADEGCCLFHEKVKRERIRIGKCVGRPIQECHNEHVKNANSFRDTTFYRSYVIYLR